MSFRCYDPEATDGVKNMSQKTITLKMADQGQSEFYVVLTTILCGTNFFI